MADRHFHTAILGGFRKKDVVNFLAEDKRRQTEELEELRRRVGALEEELDRARSDSAAAQRLEEQVADALRAQEEAKNMAEEARQAQSEARAMAQQALREQEAAQALAAKERKAREEAERRLASQLPEPVPEPRLPDPTEKIAPARPAYPEPQRQPPAPEAVPDSSEAENRLWDLCGKLDRTLTQIERLLGGSYRVTCYPEDPIPSEEGQNRDIPAPSRDPLLERGKVEEILQRVRPRK